MSLSQNELEQLRWIAHDLRAENPHLARVLLRDDTAADATRVALRYFFGTVAFVIAIVLLCRGGGLVSCLLALLFDLIGTLLVQPVISTRRR